MRKKVKRMKVFVATRTALVIATAAVLSLTSVYSASAGEKLAWKFKVGENIPYATLQKMKIEVDFGGIEIVFDVDQALDLTWKVDSIADDGSATLTQTIDRLQFRMNSGFTGEFAYDSKSGEEGEGMIWERMGDILTGLTAGTTQVTITPSGEVKDVTLSDELTKAFEAAKENEDGGGGGGFFALLGIGMDAETVKLAIAESVITLPTEAMDEGGTWSKSTTLEMGPAKQVTEKSYTYEGQEDRDGKKLAKIGVTSEIALEIDEDNEADVELEVTEQESTGAVYFDLESGKTVDSSLRTVLVLEGETPMGEVMMERTIVSSLKQGVNDDIIVPAEEESSDNGDDSDDSDSDDDDSGESDSK